MKFPKELFVSIEAAGTEDEWLYAVPDYKRHAELGERVKVGVYKFVEIAEISSSTSLYRRKP